MKKLPFEEQQILKFMKRVAKTPIEIRLKREELNLDNILQYSIKCSSDSDKYDMLSDLYGLITMGQSIIFTNTKDKAREICAKLVKEKFKVSLLIGALEPSKRDEVVKDFCSGKTTVLVATNVIARGFDVPKVNVVVNYDVPGYKGKADPADYMHRIGRTV